MKGWTCEMSSSTIWNLVFGFVLFFNLGGGRFYVCTYIEVLRTKSKTSCILGTCSTNKLYTPLKPSFFNFFSFYFMFWVFFFLTWTLFNKLLKKTVSQLSQLAYILKFEKGVCSLSEAWQWEVQRGRVSILPKVTQRMAAGLDSNLPGLPGAPRSRCSGAGNFNTWTSPSRDWLPGRGTGSVGERNGAAPSKKGGPLHEPRRVLRGPGCSCWLQRPQAAGSGEETETWLFK